MLSFSPSLRLSFFALLLVAVPCAEVPAQDAGITDPPLPDGTQSATQRVAGLVHPPGLTVSLFAAEPQLASPVAFCLDEQGRVLVAEEYRFNRGTEENRSRPFFLEDDLQLKTTADRLAMYRKFAGKFDGGMAWFTKYTDQVRLLTDQDGDGRADQSSVFAAGFNGALDGLAAGVLARGGDIYLTNIPTLWRLRDADGDGVAERREPLLAGFGVNAAYLGHDLHGLAWGPDGRLYFSVGDRGFHVATKEGRTLSLPRRGAVFRCQPDGSEFEVLHVGLRNPQELAFDDHGNLFTADNNCDKGDHSRLVWVVPGGDSGWNMAFQTIPAPYETGPWHAERMWHLESPESAAIQPACILPPLGKLGSGPGGFAYNTTICLPDQYRGRFFLCNYTGNGGIETFRVRPKGASFELFDPQDFLKPISATDCDFGYDGKLYVSDFVGLDWSGASRGGRIYTVYSQQQVESAQADELGRLFRAGFAHRENDELASLLRHADMRVRLRAQWALAERGDKAVGVFLTLCGPPLRGRPEPGRSAEDFSRLHAIWGLGQIGRKQPEVLAHLLPLLADGDAEVRTQTAKTLGEARYAAAGEKLLPLLADAEPRVRFHAAIALGQLKHKPAVQPLLELLKTNANRDKYLRHACVHALAEIGDRARVQRAATDPDAAVRLGVLLVLRRWGDDGIARFLGDSDLGIVLEAARAINDLPLDRGTGELAALGNLLLTSGETIAEPLARRIINANFRLGGPEQAATVAKMAASAKLPAVIRGESVSALGDWRNPPQRDRVTGNWRPLPARDPAKFRPAVEPLAPAILAASGGELAAAAANMVTKLELKTDDAVFVAWVRDNQRDEPARIAALEVLALHRHKELSALVASALKSDSPTLRAAALRLFAANAPDEALPLVVAILDGKTGQDNTGSSLFEKQQALASLGEMPASGASLVVERWLAKLAAGEVPLELQLDLLETARRRDEKEISAALTASLRRLDAADQPLRFRLALAGGDAARGREIFTGNRQAQCSRCHKAEGKGGDAGPDLSKIAGREIPDASPNLSVPSDDVVLKLRAYLLTSLLAPDAKIASGFGSVALRLVDGRVLAGLVKAETDDRIDLQTPDGQILRISTAEIEERTNPRSPMPAMEKVLSLRELRDVVEYLTSLK